MDKDCIVCRKHQGLEALFGGVLFENDLVFISHAQLWGEEEDHYLGHILVEALPRESDNSTFLCNMTQYTFNKRPQ